ncbi:hypothetical protein [Tenacibaculum maritimum]|uniref:hypothetical protein n=1 Tax=Tenacibaculum maritimum TaxID=107401 RepID=UPI000400BB6C|nr:hypothetical protein [Tenacibaculum maritimum]
MSNINIKAKNLYKIIDENYLTKVGNTLNKTAEQLSVFTTEEGIDMYSSSSIDINAKERIVLGNYQEPPKIEIPASSYFVKGWWTDECGKPIKKAFLGEIVHFHIRMHNTTCGKRHIAARLLGSDIYEGNGFETVEIGNEEKEGAPINYYKINNNKVVIAIKLSKKGELAELIEKKEYKTLKLFYTCSYKEEHLDLPWLFSNYLEVSIPTLVFTVHQRSFAPWYKFGSIYGISPNTFFGDNRGFSLKDNDSNGAKKAQGLGKVSSRLYQISKIDFLNNEITFEDGYASETEGRPLFIPAINARMIEKPYYKSSLSCKNNLEMRLLGQDPLVVPAPNIDCKLNLNFKLENSILSISGTVSYKAFPAYEAFIEDARGNKVFLHTFGPIHEELLAWELMDGWEMLYSTPNWLDDRLLGDQYEKIRLTNPNYDYEQPVNLQIQVINKNGKLVFKNIISAKDVFRQAVGTQEVKEDKKASRNLFGNLMQSVGFQKTSSLGLFFTEAGRKYIDKVNTDFYKGLNKIKANYESRNYTNLTLEEWNNIHLNRLAADDLGLEE